MTLIRELIDIPDRVQRRDFALSTPSGRASSVTSAARGFDSVRNVQ